MVNVFEELEKQAQNRQNDISQGMKDKKSQCNTATFCFTYFLF